MKPNLAVVFLPVLLAGWMQLTFEPSAAADSLSIVYNVNQSQTAAVGLTTFTVVTFSGSVINNTDAPIAFQLTGGPVPFEPFVASFQNGIGPRLFDLKAAPIIQASKTPVGTTTQCVAIHGLKV